jgi:serine/threonine protein kinase/Tfp pilus assembly protein PilF
MTGKIISHYKVLEKLGGGGMGIVYKAQDLKLDRYVALKFLPHSFSLDDEAKQRFIHEAKAASSLDHNNICNIYEIDETDDGQLFIAMAYYDGETLKKKIERRPLKIDEAIDITLQIAEGLFKAHEKDIIHRDIKPANIFITNDGVVKILDFGLAKVAGQSQITKTSSTVGTLAYMSPEQARGVTVDHRTDIWSLGVILYEMLSGEPPFKGDIDQVVIYSILNKEPESLFLLNPDIDPDLEKIITKALSKNLDERHQNINEILNDLLYVKEGHEIPYTTSFPKRIQRFFHRHTFTLITIVLLLLTISIILYMFLPFSETNEVTKSIAVLPFKNLNPDPENEYFCDGMTEDIITRLSQIKVFRVVSRTSVMHYKNSNKNLREIAEELNVESILEGSVRRSGEQVRVVAQLVDASQDKHIWAETYDKELKDIFNVQSDVAEKIANALQVTLSPEEIEIIKKRPTEDITAYDYYLRGREYRKRTRKDDNEYAIGFYKRALEIDPNYAQAYAGLAGSYAARNMKYGFSYNWLDSAITASQKAISIDINCTEAYSSLGLAYMMKGQYQKTINIYKKVLSLRPDHPGAVVNIGWAYHYKGNFTEAFRWFKRYLKLSPKFPAFTYNGIGSIYRHLGDFEKAEFWSNKALEIKPEYGGAKIALSKLYILKGDYEQVISLCRQAISESYYDSTKFLILAGSAELLANNYVQAKTYFEKVKKVEIILDEFWSGYIYCKILEKEQARELVKTYLEFFLERVDQTDDWWYRYSIASLYAFQGKKNDTYIWLKKAREAGWKDYTLALIDPMFESMNQEERFIQIINKLKYECIEILKQIEEMEKDL